MLLLDWTVYFAASELFVYICRVPLSIFSVTDSFACLACIHRMGKWYEGRGEGILWFIAASSSSSPAQSNGWPTYSGLSSSEGLLLLVCRITCIKIETPQLQKFKSAVAAEWLYFTAVAHTHTHVHTHLTFLCLGLPR